MEPYRRKIIIFYPKEIIEHVERAGFITPRDLARDFGYEEGPVAIAILSCLERLRILNSKAKKPNLSTRYKLTAKSKEAKKYDRSIILTIE